MIGKSYITQCPYLFRLWWTFLNRICIFMTNQCFTNGQYDCACFYTLELRKNQLILKPVATAFSLAETAWNGATCSAANETP